MKQTLVLMFFLGSTALGAQEPGPLARADSLLSSGRLAEAEATYTAYLVDHPGAATALLGRATARAWSGQHDLALGDYALVLEASPGEDAALIGSGYAHLWAGRFEKGERIFSAMVDADPSSFEAGKGLAYAALWGGRHEVAVERFARLAAVHPTESDAHAGLAEALMAARRPEQARGAARRAEELAPGRTDLRWIEREAGRVPSPIEVSVTAGRTAFDGAVGDSPFGVRSVDVAVRPVGSVTLFGQYDDGVSVDTRALALAGQAAPTYRLAAAASWGGRFITRVGGGTRSLPGGERQTLADVDHVLVVGRVGLTSGWTGLFPDGTGSEHALRLGLNVLLRPGWEASATGHLRAVADGSNGLTGVLTLTRKFQRPIDVTSGVAVGRAAATALGQHEVFAHAVARLWKGNGVRLTVRRQFGAGTDAFTAVAAGVTVGLGRR